MSKVKCVCAFCGGVFERYASVIKNKKTLFCDKVCKAEYQKTLVGELNPQHGREGKSGKDNPNYGNKWSQEQKDIASKRSKDWLNENKDEWLEINRNREWTEEGKKNIGESARARLTGITKPPMSEQQKEKIGIKSAKKFTPDFKEKYRKTMEERGHWLPKDQKDPYDVYFAEAEWIDRMFDLVYLNGAELLMEHGVFNMKTNSKGVVRDHKLGRKLGYTLGIFPQILRHPANCQIITHGNNVSKAHKCKSTDSILTVNELFDAIINFPYEWKEQEECIRLINLYKQGNRYE